VGGVATPAVDATSCTGCGACVAPCPVAAIEVH
jgi:ferredoxin-type protein NapF